ncbi:Uncharacterised protein [Amycolatopsis camponoti]|uniref:Uncharacterized protein n=1 Tax=Amycolatopsis camponoti TaxID=2606593 RepID=A0A6I8LKE1_9PSEU|nr:hypothetical protein [Amycolatopsis camponoti]VVJ17480.1 Uncharacterised protein [Amycolatopsis camponoti]
MRTTPFLTAAALTLALSSPANAVAAEAPVTVVGCSATTTGVPGQQLVLAPASVTEPVVSALSVLDPLGVLTGAFRSLWAGTAPIPLGTVPAGEAEIPGIRIADAVGARLRELPVLAPVLAPLVSTVHTSLASLCGILVRGQVPGAPPAGSPATPADPVPPGAAGGSPDAGTPIAGRQWTVAAVPGSTAGGGAVFGTPIPGQLPGASFPAGAEVPQAGGEAPVVLDARRAAGSGEALAAPRDDGLSWPVLAGILLMAAVGAQLMRRWGFRRPR